MMNTFNQLRSNPTLVGLIHGDLPALSKALARIAGVLIEMPGKLMTWSIREIASAAAVSQTSVVRFCRILPGGTSRFEAKALTGRLLEVLLQNMRFDTVYFGTGSIDPVPGLRTAMMAACQRVVVLVDSTKVRAPSLHWFVEGE